MISVRPEILTRVEKSRDFCYTKFRFSKSQVSADASEIILLVLVEYGLRQNSALATFRPNATILVDCFARTVHRAHLVPAARKRQLAAALQDYRRIWASARQPASGDGSQAAAR
jgi:hypothetical protein